MLALFVVPKKQAFLQQLRAHIWVNTSGKSALCCKELMCYHLNWDRCIFNDRSLLKAREASNYAKQVKNANGYGCVRRCWNTNFAVLQRPFPLVKSFNLQLFHSWKAARVHLQFWGFWCSLSLHPNMHTLEIWHFHCFILLKKSVWYACCLFLTQKHLVNTGCSWLHDP